MTNSFAGKGTILAVDDTAASLRLLSDLLRAEGYEVRSAINGALALRSALANPPELVLLDIQMPEMDGYEVCRRLKENPATRDVPILFLSSFSETEDKLKGFALGAVDYLTKPYQREELLARVSTHLELFRMRFHLEDVLQERTRELAEALQDLRDSDQRYRIAFRTSLDTICLSRLDDGVIIDVNDTFFDVLGYTREELIGPVLAKPNPLRAPDGESSEDTVLALTGRTTFDLGVWVEPEELAKWLEILRRDSICRNFETRLRRKDGQIFWALMSASVTEIRAVPCVLTVIRDITEARTAADRLVAAAEALRESETRYRTVFQTNLDSVMISRFEDGCVLDVNQVFLDLTGFSRDEVIGHTAAAVGIWANPADRERFLDILRQHSFCRDFIGSMRKKNGDVFWGQCSSSVFQLDGVPCLLSITRDISAAREAEEKIQSLSFYDTLTNLPNRRLLMERLRRAQSACGQSRHKRALLHIDLDHFKTVNDTLSHTIGDLLLQEVARRLRGCVHDADTVARIGGDEFAVILEELSELAEDAATEAGAVCEQILAAVDQTYTLRLLDCRCTVSIGVTIFCNQADSMEEILQQADIAMGQAKAAGRNTVRFFSRTLQTAVNARAALEEDLRQAIRTNQFLLFYQPQMNGARMVGAEALIRWKHPSQGLVTPGVFIPLAEETGMILPLGNWVIEQACRQISLWAKDHPMAGLTIAVNVSARQFQQPDFVRNVLAALDRTGADPQYLELELTESSLVDNVEEVIAKMTELKAHGLRFSLDDFGTGYSSLSYLKRLPLHTLKIDISFVRDILVDANSGVIAQTIIALGRAMGLAVIAEGVESEEQRDFLANLGCTSYQGYLFSRPLPAEDFERMLPVRKDSPELS
jgi:diguanylate cyclase (GGDEF)-like protein/PAS domain S-box-containing protein